MAETIARIQNREPNLVQKQVLPMAAAAKAWVNAEAMITSSRRLQFQLAERRVSGIYPESVPEDHCSAPTRNMRQMIGENLHHIRINPNARTGGNGYLIGIFVGECDAWLGCSRQ